MRHAADPNVFFGTSIIFPNIVARGRASGIDVRIEPAPTTVPLGGAVRPLNGVLASRATETGALTPLRSWRDALADYMERAGLVATVST